MDNICFTITTDKSKIDVDAVKALLNQSYWANERSKEIIKNSMENSICYGVFKENELIGFGRVVTDYSTVYYICDIIVDEKYRGNNIGKTLVKNITNSKELNGLMGILATKDAHGIYEQYGFVKDPQRFMAKKRPI